MAVTPVLAISQPSLNIFIVVFRCKATASGDTSVTMNLLEERSTLVKHVFSYKTFPNAFVSENKPTYVQFEKFIAESATNLNAASVAELNAAITGYQHADETRQSILSAVGLPDGKPTDAINLNHLDDWQEFHAAELA